MLVAGQEYLVDDRELIHALREQMSNLSSVFALSMMLFDRLDDDEIVKLVLSAVPALAPCQAEGTYLLRDDLCRHGDGNTELQEQLRALAGAEASITPPGHIGAGWAWAYPLRAIGGHAGYLVVTARGEPNTDQQFLVRTLAAQAGAALTSAALYRGERAASTELRERNQQLATANNDLTNANADLEQRRRTHETLTKVAASGPGETAIATALYELTGLHVLIEDRFGNLLGWAGHQKPAPRPRLPAHQRTELLARIQRNARPLRHRDRILALAQPRDDILGVLTLYDPDHKAGQHELFALEHATLVLAMQLAHQRSLAETELRLRGDLVDDLLTGATDTSAISRAAALGHNLHPPHQVLIVHWPNSPPDKLARTIDQATTHLTQTRPLLRHRGDTIVVITPAETPDGAPPNWTQLHQRLTTSHPTNQGAIGTGRPYPDPHQLPKSYAEAQKALHIQQNSTHPHGITTYNNLGFYRILANTETQQDINDFIEEWLGPLIHYDTTHHYDLVTTLWQYYENGGNYDATAHALLIHRSTLRYRLRRIRELTGHDLSHVNTRLNLHIATRAWQIQHNAT
jgi:sugar diacid utilization regulator